LHPEHPSLARRLQHHLLRAAFRESLHFLEFTWHFETTQSVTRAMRREVASTL
jgi:hypothetical protein